MPTFHEPFPIDDAAILAARPERNAVAIDRPYAFLVEPECDAQRRVSDVATIFLTNRECPFRCLMCDLWKNTTIETVPRGAIPRQIDYALERLPPARHIKLYNSGNFFDAKAIPPDDWPAIIDRLRGFDSIIVENHPRLCGPAVFDFQRQLARIGVELEVALGLETIHPDLLPRLNKQMTLDDFASAATRLHAAGIRTRAFVLLRPPFLNEAEGLEWALRSTSWAFDLGIDCVAVIPTRSGNGMLEKLAISGSFEPPKLRSLEAILDQGLALRRGRVMADLWDATRLKSCPDCQNPRIGRIRQMNLSQQSEPVVNCPHCDLRTARQELS